MNRRHSLLVGLLMLGATNAQSLPGPNDPPAEGILPPAAVRPAQTKQGPTIKDFSRIPLSFERNQGQTDSRVRFLTHSGDSTLFLTPSEAVFSMTSKPLPKERRGLKGRKAHASASKIARVAVRMQMVGANPKAVVLQQRPLAGKVNYFVGNDPKKWHKGVPTFGKVGFQGIYPGVDLVYYGNQQHLEYDFVVAPHADPNKIKLHFAGAKGVRVNAAGELLVRAQGRELKWQKPVVYQQDATGKHAVAAHFRLKKLSNGQSGVSFALGRYDTARPLVIDPVLIYSTYLGGEAAAGRGDFTTAIAVDNSGSAYVTGNAYSIDFPINDQPIYLNTDNTVVALNENNTSSAVAFITKINPQGTDLVYSTFLGGSTRDSGEAIAVDSQGNAYVAGETSSADFPVTLGAFQTGKFVAQGDTVFVTALDSMGQTLIYSTYLGGTNQDEAFAIAVDNQSAVYVAGDASSTDFPVGTSTGANPFQTRLKASQGQTAFVTKFDAGGNGVYSTYLGGEYQDQASGIAVDANGDAFVTGWTNSGKFPTTKGAFQTTAPQTSRSDSSAYVTEINPNGTGLIYSTYLGGTTGFGDIGYAIALDSNGSAYVTGAASSFDFPVTKGAFQSTDRRTVSYTAFVTKLNPKGTALVYSTYLGGSNSPQGTDGDIANSIAVDSTGSAYVTGETTNTDFPTTVGAFQRASGLYGDSAFLTKLNPNGTGLMYSTYLSGSGIDPNQSGEYGRGVAVDPEGNIYVTGSTASPDFPVTDRAFQSNNFSDLGGANSFITKLAGIPIYPDFNNDGNTDILIQNPSTGAIAAWYMRGAIKTGGTSFSLTPPAEYALVGAGDFSSDGSTTLVLQSSITNQIVFWHTSGTNGATISGGNYVNVTPAAGWKVVGVGDFNKDGKSDLVFQNQTTGQIAIWFMNGYLFNGGLVLPFSPAAGWKVAGAGDFNGDGLTDLVFQNQTTGQVCFWYFNGTTYLDGMVMTAVPTAGWKIVGVGDFNGDGVSDLLFQSAFSNHASIWYTLDGFFFGGDTISASLPSGFKIVGPR